MNLVQVPFQIPLRREFLFAQFTTDLAGLEMYSYHVGYDVLFPLEDSSADVAFGETFMVSVVAAT